MKAAPTDPPTDSQTHSSTSSTTTATTKTGTKGTTEATSNKPDKCPIKQAKRQTMSDIRRANSMEFLLTFSMSLLCLALKATHIYTGRIDTNFTLHYLLLISSTCLIYLLNRGHIHIDINYAKSLHLRQCEDPIGFSVACLLLPSVALVFFNLHLSLLILSASTFALLFTAFAASSSPLLRNGMRPYFCSLALTTAALFALYLRHDSSYNYVALVIFINFLTTLLVYCCKQSFTISEACIISVCVTYSIQSNVLLFRDQFLRTLAPFDLYTTVGIGTCVLFALFCVAIPCEEDISKVLKPQHGTVILIKLVSLGYTLLDHKFSALLKSLSPESADAKSPAQPLKKPIPWFLNHVTQSPTNVALITTWALILLTIFLKMNTVLNNLSLSKPTIRKFYHLVSFSIFFSGIQFNLYLLKTGCVVGLFILLLGEAIRIRSIGSHASYMFVNRFAKTLLDERDSGHVIVSHIYLLLGCAIPVWIASDASVDIAKVGVVAICIQDGVAAVAGKQFGKTQWGRRGRTVEGSVAGIVAASIAALLWIGSKELSLYSAAAVVVAASYTGLVEAFTDQADNLVVPLTFCTVYNAFRGAAIL